MIPYLSEVDIIPIFAIFICIGLPLLIPIINMLLKHQRTMAELTRGQGQMGAGVSAEMERMRNEISELKTTLVEHSLSLERNVENLQHRMSAIESRSESIRGDR